MKKISLWILLTLIAGTTILLWRSAQKTTPQQSLNTIIIGTNTEFQPFSFKEDDEIVGFDIDVIKEVFTRLNKNFIFQDMPFDALIPEIQLGNIHVLAAGMTPTKERAKRILFTNPHLTSDYLVIISLANNPISSLHDLKNKTIVVNEGYTADNYLSEQKDITVLRISSANVSDGIMALKSNRADAFVSAFNPIKPYFKKFGTDGLIVTPIKDTEESSAFAISKHYPDLQNFIQITLDRMEADGTLDALRKKWDLQ